MHGKSTAFFFAVTFVFAILMISTPLYAKIEKNQEGEYQAKLEKILLNKTLTAKVTFPASKNGIDLNIDGSWDNKDVTRRIKNTGIGIDINDPATVTTIKLKEQHIEIHLNGGGYGTFGDNLMRGLTKNAAARAVEIGSRAAGKASGGSRINLRFNRDIQPDDIDPEKLAKCLDPLMNTSSMAVDIVRNNIPDEFKEAAAKGEIVAGMPKAVVFAIKGEPAEKKVDLDVTPPVEKWQYKLDAVTNLLIIFDGGKVKETSTF